MYEKTPLPVVMGTYLVGYAIGFGVAHINMPEDHSAEAASEAQLRNGQVYKQLSAESDQPVNELTVDIDGETYTYHTTTNTGQAETCSGSYEVRDDVAVAVGELACTQTSTIGK